ncbi:uncharacterized protein G2W53_025496 [Senna tora]|uniref:Uncharacterized protein n=1 Tax=Senna tora TaxID=362788 RepID=A0A834WHY8_9FABA|nr:uncharacterized protein G2W53_025496 [Senna tora]
MTPYTYGASHTPRLHQGQKLRVPPTCRRTDVELPPTQWGQTRAMEK